MTLYELLRSVSSILAPSNSSALFDYIIRSMNCYGEFLRSRYCYRDKTLLTDFECGDLKSVLVTLRTPFDFCNSSQYYEESDLSNSPQTLLQMQLFVSDLSKEEQMAQKIRWSCSVDFCYPIKIDLIGESFEILPAASLSAKTGIEKANKKLKPL